MRNFKRKYINCFLIFTLILNFVGMGDSMAGDSFSNEGNALYGALLEELIKKNICTNNQNCFDALQMYREDGERIYMNMYAQEDKKLCILVVDFLVRKGLEITNGKPITLQTFKEPKAHYVGAKSLFSRNEPSLKLELNK